MLKSQTVSQPFVVEGIGLHTGSVSRVEVHPATVPSGRIFLIDGVEIPALAEFVTDTRRCTTLGRQNRTISTVEHLLAACMLAHVDHARVIVDGPELPALDGSALHWLEALQGAGIATLDEPVVSLSYAQPCWIEEGESQCYLLPSEQFSLFAALDIPGTCADHRCVGGVVDAALVCKQIARARTFGLEREVQALLQSGLARGGSLDNAVVLTETGYLNAQVWPDEPAWHKVLDLLGDLALVGARITGTVLAVRAGHRHHVALARRLREQWLAEVVAEHETR